MYNGIGLDTVRGSGTNGFVQRNLSFIRKHKDRVDYKSEAEIQKLDQQMMKPANREILDHERKRKVELKCMEMQELMEEQGYPPDEITSKVSTFRKMLMDKEGVTEGSIEKDEAGRPLAKETHQLAEANEEKNLRLRDAFGLSEFYVDGSSFDPERRAKEDAAKAVALAQKKYSLVEISGSEGSSRSPSPAKVKKKSRDESKSPDRNEKKKKSKKHKQDKSESKRHKSKSKHKHKKRGGSGEEKKKKRKRQPSSSSESEGTSEFSEPERVSRNVGKSRTISRSESGSPCAPRRSQVTQRANSPEMRRKQRASPVNRTRSPVKKSVAARMPSRSPPFVARKRPAASSTSDSSSDSSRSPSPPKQIRKKQRNKTNNRESPSSPMPIKQNGSSKKRNVSPAPDRNVRDDRSPAPRSHHSRSLSYSPANKKPRKSTPPLSTNRTRKSPPPISKSRHRSYSRSRSRSPKRKSRKSPVPRSKRRSRSSSSSRSRSRSYRRYSSSESRSYSRSRSRSSRRDSRSPSIRRRHGSPSHLDKRRITR